MSSLRYLCLLCVFSTVIISCNKNSSKQAQANSEVLPTPQQTEWANAEIGVIIHLDIDIFAPEKYRKGDKSTLPSLNVFDPSKLNTDQCVKTAKSAGAKYAVLVAKHGTGFALWPTKANSYNVSNTPWQNGNGDIVASFIKSCKKYGIKPGVYYSVNSNKYYEAENLKSDSARKAYNKAVLEQEKELWTNYGKWFEIWFDGGTRAGITSRLAKMIKKYQPQAILFQGPFSNDNLIRWAGNERGEAPYPMWSRADTITQSQGKVEIKGLHGDPNGSIWAPAESDFPSRKKSAWKGGWFWRANRPQDVISLHKMVKRYYTTVGRNTNMLIGMAIDTSGQFPQKETHLFAQFGHIIKKRFGHDIAHASGKGKNLVLQLGDQPEKVNQIVLMEEIAKGERIRNYAVQARLNGQWKTVCSGKSVGHKRIQTFQPIRTKKLRLHISRASRKPIIKKFAAYDVKDLQQ
jgi:alpha-L-fucosidase